MKPFLPGRLEYENYPEMEVWKIILAWQYTWICFVGVLGWFVFGFYHGKSPFFTIWENMFGPTFSSIRIVNFQPFLRLWSEKHLFLRTAGMRELTPWWWKSLEKIQFYGLMFSWVFVVMFSIFLGIYMLKPCFFALKDLRCCVFFSKCFLKEWYSICLVRKHSAMRSGKWEMSIVMLLH